MKKNIVIITLLCVSLFNISTRLNAADADNNNIDPLFARMSDDLFETKNNSTKYEPLSSPNSGERINDTEPMWSNIANSQQFTPVPTIVHATAINDTSPKTTSPTRSATKDAPLSRECAEISNLQHIIEKLQTENDQRLMQLHRDREAIVEAHSELISKIVIAQRVEICHRDTETMIAKLQHSKRALRSHVHTLEFGAQETSTVAEDAQHYKLRRAEEIKRDQLHHIRQKFDLPRNRKFALKQSM